MSVVLAINPGASMRRMAHANFVNAFRRAPDGLQILLPVFLSIRFDVISLMSAARESPD